MYPSQRAPHAEVPKSSHRTSGPADAVVQRAQAPCRIATRMFPPTPRHRASRPILRKRTNRTILLMNEKVR